MKRPLDSQAILSVRKPMLDPDPSRPTRPTLAATENGSYIGRRTCSVASSERRNRAVHGNRRSSGDPVDFDAEAAALSVGGRSVKWMFG